ncbi:MAG: hypothetical protein J6Y62_02050 [Clostridia bacterium]|nr:hypothetical protein [Clostridia bacterium]
MKKLMYGVAIGDRYLKQARVMVESFRQHNKDWETKVFNEAELNLMLPPVWRSKDAFFKCETGRWCVMKQALLNGYDVVLYCDNDIFWYGKYEEIGRGLSLCPHYVTDKARRSAIHWLIKDGVPNLGLFEASGTDLAGLIDGLVEEVGMDPAAHMHGQVLWLQNLATYLPYLGYEVNYMTDPGLNVARWNLGHGDRQVIEREGKLIVVCDGEEYPLKCFHFSSKSIKSIEQYGDVVRRLRDQYIRRIA